MIRLLPPWLLNYRRTDLSGDLIASAVVATLMVPQALAYALLAGLPPAAGFAASVLPLFAYAWLGRSAALAVGPFAVLSLMTASALAPFAATAPPGSARYTELAATLAWLVGGVTLAAGWARLGIIVNLLSRPATGGFIAGSAILIAASQLKHVLGIDSAGQDVVTVLMSLAHGAGHSNPVTITIAAGTMLALPLLGDGLSRLLRKAGLVPRAAELVARAGPLVVLLLGLLVTMLAGLDHQFAVKTVGTWSTSALASFTVPAASWPVVRDLLGPALGIALVGFVSAHSVVVAFAGKVGEPGQRVDADRELLALGTANVVAGAAGGFPVSSSLSRSAVNVAAGARTPLAGVLTAVWMALVAAFGAVLLSRLPTAVLAATILVAVVPLASPAELRRLWRYDRREAAVWMLAAVGVILFGVTAGIVTGVTASLATWLWRASRPHIAVLGRVPGTDHFRNVERYAVETRPDRLLVRIDESLMFANAQYVEAWLRDAVARRPEVRCVVLSLAAVNFIDATGLQMLDTLAAEWRSAGINVHLSELKGPVADRVRAIGWVDRWQAAGGRVFLQMADIDDGAAAPAADPR